MPLLSGSLFPSKAKERKEERGKAIRLLKGMGKGREKAQEQEKERKRGGKERGKERKES